MPCPRDLSRVDRYGRAYKGSQRQIQSYVNLRPSELSKAIAAEMASPLPHGAHLSWVSPLANQRYAEYRDSEFLEVLDLHGHNDALRAFWPARGPCWDALARIEGERISGVVLVEAKSYVDELFSSGTGAKGDSLRQIKSSLQKAKQWLAISEAQDWTGPLYQSANRLAHLYFLREIAKVPARLVNIYFLDDPHRPTSRKDWKEGLRKVRADLGLAGEALEFVSDVFLDSSDGY